jgi:imidazolonepropionase-like amidohydrolase
MTMSTRTRLTPRTTGLAARTALIATAIAIASLLAGPVSVDAQMPAPPQAGVTALVGGTIHTLTGTAIEGGTIVFENGVITAVGRDVPVPAGALSIDITGRHVYPGLIDAHSQMGLYEIGAVPVTVDLNEVGPFNPNVRARLAFNPESRHIGTARSNGVLVAVSSPTGGIIAGLASAMALDGWTWEQMTLAPDAALMVHWPLPFQQRQYDEATRNLRDFFATARAYRSARAADPARNPVDPRLDAMIPVLERRIPVVIHASELQQIQDAVTWGEQEGVRIVLLGGHDAGYIADVLARRGVPVIITSVLDSPNRAWEPYDDRYTLPARLHAAGVTFAIAGAASAPYANRLPYEAGAAMAFGLPAEEALRAVTLYPARILGLEDRLGSLDPGKDATLLVTTGDPLEYATRIERAFILGRQIDLADAHRQFFERYSERVRQEHARQHRGPD